MKNGSPEPLLYQVHIKVPCLNYIQRGKIWGCQTSMMLMAREHCQLVMIVNKGHCEKCAKLDDRKRRYMFVNRMLWGLQDFSSQYFSTLKSSDRPRDSSLATLMVCLNASDPCKIYHAHWKWQLPITTGMGCISKKEVMLVFILNF